VPELNRRALDRVSKDGRNKISAVYLLFIILFL